MISIGRLGGGHLDYYTRELAAGAEGYYIRNDQPGQWWGDLAGRLGLVGEVDREDLRAIFEGRDPGDGSVLRSRKVERVAFDFTLSVPKSVSLLWALGDNRIAGEVLAAIDHANDVALGFLQAHASGVRRGHGGCDHLKSDGLVVGRFTHVASRAGDPQLHVHNVIANLSVGSDGRWSALDSHLIYEWGHATSHVFEAVLRHELGRRLRVRFQVDKRRIFEIPDVPVSVRKAFSQRRTQIQDFMDERGWTSRKASDWANIDTRAAKNHDVTVDELRAQWQDKAAALGYRYVDVLGRRPSPGIPASNDDLARALTETDATFTLRDIYIAIAVDAVQGATLPDIEARAVELLRSGLVLRAGDGRFTTQEILDLEQAAVDTARRGLGDGVGRADPAVIDEAVAERPSLSKEQAAVVWHMCTSGNRYDTVVGRAGSGKTFSLDAARQAWEGSGLVVLGAAPSAAAAQQLTDGAGIEATSVDRLLSKLDRGRLHLDQRYVIVCDEAAMLGSRRLDRLIEHVDRAGAKLVAIGDNKQLPAVDAGGLYAAIGRRCGYVQLTENRRQQNPEERQALNDLRAGRSSRAVARMAANGQLVTASNADQLRQVLVGEWARHRHEGRDVVMQAHRTQDTEDLNQRARAILHAEGALGPVVARVDDIEYAIGDRVVAHFNRYDLGILNANRGTVRGAQDGRLLVDLDAGHQVRLPADYLEAGHLTHAYAATIHKNQGITCDVSLTLGNESLTKELGYTAVTRGRLLNQIFVVRGEREHNHGLDLPEPGAFDMLDQALARSQAKTAAIDRGGPGLSL